jgi:hypothetical protein
LFGEGEVLVIAMPGKKGSRTPFRLSSFREKLRELRSSTFHHKNTADYNYYKNKDKKVAFVLKRSRTNIVPKFHAETMNVSHKGL